MLPLAKEAEDATLRSQNKEGVDERTIPSVPVYKYIFLKKKWGKKIPSLPLPVAKYCMVNVISRGTVPLPKCGVQPQANKGVTCVKEI